MTGTRKNDGEVSVPSTVVPRCFRIEAASHTDVGPMRNHNEDDRGVFPALGLYFVTDGMGGQHTGDRVARLTVKEMQSFYTESHASPTKPWPFELYPERSHEENRLAVAIRSANRGIREGCREDRSMEGSGTTVAAVAITGEQIHLAHVGDCRIYRLRGGAVELLTQDHTLAFDARTLVPDLTEEQLASIPKNVLTRALGANEDVLVDTRSEPLMTGDVYFLATDGGCASLENQEIAAILLAQPALDLAVRELIDAALQRDGSDNATAVLVRISSRLETDSL